MVIKKLIMFYVFLNMSLGEKELFEVVISPYKNVKTFSGFEGFFFFFETLIF